MCVVPLSSCSCEGKLSASENGSPGLLSPARSDMSNGDAESVSPRSSVSSEQSLTTQVRGQHPCLQILNAVCDTSMFEHRHTPGSCQLQLLLGHRPNLFTRTSMSAGSSDASLIASPLGASNSLGTVQSQKSSPDQAAASGEALHIVVHSARSSAQVHAASAGTFSMLLE